MNIIRDIVNNDIELIGDDEDEDVEIGSCELHESRPDRYFGRCKHYGAGCEWRIRASVNEKRDPDIPIKVSVKEIVSRFGYTVAYRKAWIAKQLAMSRIYGDWEGSYNELPRGIEDPTSFILDRLAALRTQLQQWSNVESVYCIRHLASNFNKEFRDPDLKDKVMS
ncbi:hypothetical protein Lal_00044749 [Lupinus albus]|nr:hypothetical protein Lal_00044749 [Lupinus albus]